MWPFKKKEIKEEIVYKEVEVPKEVLVEKEVVKEIFKEIPVEVKKEVFTETTVFVPKRTLGNFRRGMWVMSAGRVGIIFRFEGVDKAVVHLVNDKGETYKVETEFLYNIRQARKKEVPACRKGEIHKFDYPE